MDRKKNNTKTQLLNRMYIPRYIIHRSTYLFKKYVLINKHKLMDGNFKFLHRTKYFFCCFEC